MDTPGLYYFALDNKMRLSDEFRLRNTKLIIDSDQCANILYKKMCLNVDSINERPDFLGGDLVAYKQFVEAFFANLAQCNIQPVVVGGGQKSRDERQNTSSFSYKLKLENFKPKLKPPEEKTIQTPLVSLIFNQVVEELQIETKVAHNRHSTISELANQLDCPVLSNYADFFFYSLKKGFIIPREEVFDYESPKESESGGRYIECRLYSQRKMIEALPGLMPSTVPLLRIIMSFDWQHNSIRKAKRSIGNTKTIFSQEYPKNKEIASYLTWMQGKSCVELIGEFCDKVDYFKGDKDLREQLEAYMIRETERVVEVNSGQDMQRILELHYQEHADETTKRAAKCLSDQCDRLVSGCILYNLLFKINYRYYFCLQDDRQPSQHCLRVRPLSVALCLLRPRPYDKLTGVELTHQIKKDTFILVYYDKSHNCITEQVHVYPARHLEHFGSLDGLFVNSLVKLPEDEKRKLLLATFRCSCEHLEAMDSKLSAILEGQAIVEVRLLLILLRYINQENNPTYSLDDSFILASILTCTFYTTTGGPLDEQTRRELQSISKQPNIRSEKRDDSLIVHQIYSLHVAIDAFCMLNDLLGQLFPRPNIGLWFDGPLMFKLTKSGPISSNLLAVIMEMIVD